MDWYWSLMVLWLAGISIFQKKRDIQLTKKGVRVKVDAKQRGVWVSRRRNEGGFRGFQSLEIRWKEGASYVERNKWLAAITHWLKQTGFR
jgi:hypothetical protein